MARHGRLRGLELILGVEKDPTFGAVLPVGTGGIAAEILADRSPGLPSLYERLDRRMFESIACWPLLRGFRGQPPVDLDRWVELLIRFSSVVADFPQIGEVDVNP